MMLIESSIDLWDMLIRCLLYCLNCSFHLFCTMFSFFSCHFRILLVDGWPNTFAKQISKQTCWHRVKENKKVLKISQITWIWKLSPYKISWISITLPVNRGLHNATNPESVFYYFKIIVLKLKLLKDIVFLVKKSAFIKVRHNSLIFFSNASRLTHCISMDAWKIRRYLSCWYCFAMDLILP